MSDNSILLKRDCIGLDNTMDEKDEFCDNIDWSTVDLPSISSSMVVEHPQSIKNPPNIAAESNENCKMDLREADPDAIVAGVGSLSTVPNFSSLSSEANLRKEIENLRNELQSKNDTIFELEASMVTSCAESKSHAQQAEQDARRRIHLVEEELRRVRMEADKYKSNWIRQKKRIAELESTQSMIKSATINSPNASTSDSVRENIVTIPGTEKTPNSFAPNQTDQINTRKQEDDGKSATISGIKRKMQQSFDASDTNTTLVDDHPHFESPSVSCLQFLSCAIGNDCFSLSEEDAARLRLAKHLLTRIEMDCYSYQENVTIPTDQIKQEKLVHPERHRGPKSGATELFDKSSSQTHCDCEENTKSFVKSLLLNMVGIPEQHHVGLLCAPKSIWPAKVHLAVSGLLFALLEKFNSMFYFDVNSERKNGYENEIHPTLCAESVLYLLAVLNDLLLVSRASRTNLRWWIYQQRQVPQGGKQGFQRSSVSTLNGKEPRQANAIDRHSRIEGLAVQELSPSIEHGSKEMSLTTNCERDPATVRHQSNIFFDTLVALMKGSVSTTTNSKKKMEWKYTMIQRTQLRAIDLVLVLMSDADTIECYSTQTRKTPHLWKLWFDALLPINFKTRNESCVSPAAKSVKDFLSNLEERSSKSLLLHASGRQNVSELFVSSPDNNILPMEERGVENASSSNLSCIESINSSNKSGVIEFTGWANVKEQLSNKIKCRTTQLLSLFILSSSSVCQSMFAPHLSPSNIENPDYEQSEDKMSFGRRFLAAVLGEIEDFILPFLSSIASIDLQSNGMQQCLEICHSYVHFVQILSNSLDGIKLLTLKMRSDSKQGHAHCWSQSAIGCMVQIFDSTINCVFAVEGSIRSRLQNIGCLSSLKMLLEQCISFFTNLLTFVRNSRQQLASSASSKIEAISFLALISGNRLTFLSSCRRILVRGNAIDEEWKCAVRILLSEVLLDKDEEIQQAKVKNVLR